MSAYRIGIDLGGTKIEGVLMDRKGQIVHRHRVPTPRGDYTGTLDAISDLVDALAAPSEVIVPVGIGIPGSLSPQTGLVRNANSTWLIGHPLREDLEARLERPVRLANDANCFTLSEAVDGAGKGGRTVFGVILGTGVGGGIVVDGRLLEGATGIAGEWGHNPLPQPREDERPGPTCYCGRAGCIETWLSGPALERSYRELGGEPITGPEITARAAHGEAIARRSLDLHAERAGRALAIVVNIVDPDVIVLGGGLSGIPNLSATIARAMVPHVFSDVVRAEICQNRHGPSSGVRGAAWLWPADGS